LEPKPDTWAATLIKGDKPGIVATDYDEKTYVVSFEGNLYGSLPKWEDRVMHAADRLATCYPTVARGVLDKSQFEVIGVIDKPKVPRPNRPMIGNVWQIELTND
jgi:hypothetical protein